MNTSFRKLNVLVSSLICLTLLAAPLPSLAATFNIPPGDVAALIDAIIAANDEGNYPGLDIINLAANSTYALETVISTDTGLPFVTTPIVLNGNNATITRHPNAQGFLRAFLVLHSGNLTVNQLNISGMYTNSGAIYNYGQLIVNGGTFDSNEASSSGAGIENNGGVLEVNGSNFTNNISATGFAAIVGGAVSTLGATNATISDSNFSGNQGSGAVNFSGSLQIEDSTFDNNGPGNAVLTKAGSTSITNSFFTNNNSGTNYGGSVFGEGANFTITNSIFDGNSTQPANGSGGGIFIVGGSLNLTNSVLRNNSAGAGGGVAIGGYPTPSLEMATITNTQFTNNTASGDGGAIVMFSEGTLTLDSNTFSGNSSTNGGGGAILVVDGHGTITNSNFSNNTAQVNGGALYIVQRQTVDFTAHNSCFTNNSNSALYFDSQNGAMDATNNWWGAFDGPSGVGTGHGDSVGGNVTYIPFLTTAPAGCDTIYDPPNSPPSLTSDQSALPPVAEGQTANNTGTVTDPDGDVVSLSASIGSVVNNGNGTWSWSYLTTDGPAESQTVTITGDDGYNDPVQTTFDLTVNNEPPTATFANLSGTIPENSSATLAFSNQVDPSPVDTTAGFRYSYDCTNDGAFDVTDTTAASYNGCLYTSPGVFTARGRIRDKDNGYTDYTASVSVADVPTVNDFVVLGKEGVWLKQSSDVLSGDVGASNASGGPYLDSGVEVSIGQGVHITNPQSAVFGDSVWLKTGSQVAALYYNDKNGNGVAFSLFTPLSLPVIPAFPPVPSFSPGAADVTVPVNGTQTLAAGSYRNLLVNHDATLTLSGGIYNFNAWDLRDDATIYIAAPTEIRIADKLGTNIRVKVMPAPGSGLDASDIKIFVTGINGSNGNIGATPKAAQFGMQNTLQANVYAPNGTLFVRENSVATGAFLGKWVVIGDQVQLTHDTAFQ